jgi:hypothetical protein
MPVSIQYVEIWQVQKSIRKIRRCVMITDIKKISLYVLCFMLVGGGYSSLIIFLLMTNSFLGLFGALIGAVSGIGILPIGTMILHHFLIKLLPEVPEPPEPKEKHRSDHPSRTLLLKKFLILATCVASALGFAQYIDNIAYALVPQGDFYLILIVALIGSLAVIPILIFVIYALLRKLFL